MYYRWFERLCKLLLDGLELMIHKTIKNFITDVRDRQRITVALAKGAVALQNRRVILSDPASWEFSAFSQNGEDGILHTLRSQLLRSNRYFAEIAAADGIENNTAWLAIAEKYDGLMIEGSRNLIERAQRLIQRDLNIGVHCEQMFVTRASAPAVRSLMACHDPDVFSLDIDGNDYYVAHALWHEGIRPKIWVVEYNSVFGATRAVTVKYRDDFTIDAHPSRLYYGVSITAWRRFFAGIGYRFVAVDRHGVNAFFVDPALFNAEFLNGLQGASFVENIYQLNKFGAPSETQFRLIEHMELEPVGA